MGAGVKIITLINNVLIYIYILLFIFFSNYKTKSVFLDDGERILRTSSSWAREKLICVSCTHEN